MRELNNRPTTVDGVIVNCNCAKEGNSENRENEIQSRATNDLNSKPPNSIAMKKSRTRDQVGASLGGILASLSLVNDGNENCGTDIDSFKKKTRRGDASRTLLSKRKFNLGRETCHQKESILSAVKPITIQQTPEKNEETNKIPLEVPLKSSSSMVLFPSVATSNTLTQNIPPQAIRRDTRIYRFTSMMTPSPIRDNEYRFPSVVRICSSPIHPSPLGESLSPQHFVRLKNERKSPSASSTSFSTRTLGLSREIEEEVEGEAEDDTSIEISIYRPSKKQTRPKRLRENGDDEEASEIYSDEDYQQVDTNSDTSDDDNLSYIVDMDEYNSGVEEISYVESTNSKTYDGLSISDYCPDSTDSDTESEDRRDGEKYSTKIEMTQNCTIPTASITLSTGSGGMGQDIDLVKVVVLEDCASGESSDQDKTILASVDEHSSEVEYSSDVDHDNNSNDNEISSVYLQERKCNSSQSLTRIQGSDSLCITRKKHIKSASYSSKKNPTRVRRRHAVKRGKWTLGSKIGSGSFGVVHVGMNSCTGNLMAVKSLSIPSSSSNETMKDLQREIGLMRTLSHPNIVRYIGAETDTVKHILHIFQEWIPGGDLSSLLRKFGPFPLPVVRSYLFQIFSGLEYLHSNRILHRDIKGSNVLVNDEGIVKLADFGASKRIKLSENGPVNDMEDMMETMTMRGTPYFMAPEVFFCKYGSKADIWSSGGVAYQMCTGKAPWRDLDLKTPMSLFTYLKKHSGPPFMSQRGISHDMNESKSPLTCKSLQDLLEMCFHRDPAKRPTAHESLQHSFFTQTDPNESLNEDGSMTSSMATASEHIRSPISPISPISPLQVIEMKKNSTNGKINKCRLKNKKHFRIPFDTSDWPLWGKQAMIGREERIQKDENPFVKK